MTELDLTESDREADAVLQVRDLKVHFPAAGRGQVVRAVDGVSFDIARGESLGLIGESGCGKSTLGRAIVRLNAPTAGSIRFDGRDVASVRGTRSVRAARRGMQMVFQDPATSLDPRMTVQKSVMEPALARTPSTRTRAKRRAQELLERVGLGAEVADRYPHQLSGGQLQRVSIARALMAEPRLIVLDEPVSALDVSVQAQIVNLLGELQHEFGLSYLFIAHDLAVVRQLCTRVAIMYLGKLAEFGARDQIFGHAQHPYTTALLSAVPIPDPDARRRHRIVLHGDAPSPITPPSGCRFRTRCWKADEACADVEPLLAPGEHGQLVACHHPEPGGDRRVAEPTSDAWTQAS